MTFFPRHFRQSHFLQKVMWAHGLPVNKSNVLSFNYQLFNFLHRKNPRLISFYIISPIKINFTTTSCRIIFSICFPIHPLSEGTCKTLSLLLAVHVFPLPNPFYRRLLWLTPFHSCRIVSAVPLNPLRHHSYVGRCAQLHFAVSVLNVPCS